MPRLNIKSTKAAFIKELKDLEEKAKRYSEKHPEERTNHFYVAQWALMSVAKELELKIKMADYQS